METAGLRQAYEALKEEAARLAGGPGDIAQRAALHGAMHLDSRGNHGFPLIALHGALWAYGFFETTGRLGQLLRYRYFYSPKERGFRMGLLNGFAEGFKAVNRRVFIDTYANYFITKARGRSVLDAGLLQPDLAQGLLKMHEARAADRQLEPADHRWVFEQALAWEQETTVAPGVREEIDRFDCPILRNLCLRPVVRFAYFPKRTWFWFRNFSDTTERLAWAKAAYSLAEAAGWDRVRASTVDYPGAMLPAVDACPALAADLRQSILGAPGLAQWDV